MKYSASGSSELCDWDTAAAIGGSVPAHAETGERRSHNVDAWVDVDGESVNVTGVWMSQMPEQTRRALLRELSLPVKKQLVYVSQSGVTSLVGDLRVITVWDGWCEVELRPADGSVTHLPVHSMHLSEMNKASGTGVETSPRTQTTTSKMAKVTGGIGAKKVDGMPLDVVVFDLETTGCDWHSDQICEIAALRVAGGEITAKFEQLVHIDVPMPKDAGSVNNITDDMLTDAPHMTEAMRSFAKFVGAAPVLVGHNIKSYDLPFVERVASECGVGFSYSDAIDTLTLARRAWPNLKSYSMSALRDRLEIGQEGAHRALRDCYDELALYMAIRKDVSEGHASIAERRTRSQERPGAKYSRKWSRRKAKEFTTDVAVFDESHPIYGRGVVVSGEVPGHDYDQCLQAVCDLGGVPQDNVTKKTCYLVVGEDHGAGKLRKAEEYAAAGAPIRIIDADEFMRLVGWEE